MERLPSFADQHGSDNPILERWFDRLQRTIAVDFDGVLHPYTAGWCGSVPADEPPIPGAREFLHNHVQAGYRIVIFSSRVDHKEGLDGVWAWLNEHDLAQYVEEVTHTKVAAVAYVDDRAVPFAGDWQSVAAGVAHLVRTKSARA